MISAEARACCTACCPCCCPMAFSHLCSGLQPRDGQ